MPLYVKSLGIGPVEWGVLASAWALGMFSVEWVWGNLSDTRDRRYLMLVSALSMSVLFVLFTVHALISLFIALELAAGMLGVAFGPTTRTYVSSESPEKSTGLFAGLWWASLMLGQVIGPIVGSFLAQSFSFKYSFYASSILSLVLATFVLWSFPTDTRHREKSHETKILTGLKFVLNLRSARLLFLAALLIFVGRALVIAFLPLYASSIINMSTIQVGLLFAALSATELVSMPVLGWLSDRFGVKRTAVLSYAVSAFLFLLYFVAKTIYQIFLVSIALGVGLSGLFVLLALIPTVAPRGTYGKVIGVYGSFEDLGIMVGPLIFGFVWSAYGPVYIFAVAALAQLLAVFLVLRIRKKSGD
jgi:DHA1 family multidrug resistance protein-like MFS transporter